MSCPEKQVSGRRVAPLPGGRPATPQTPAQAQEQEQPDEIANQFHENHYTSDRPGYIFADERFSSKSGSRPRSANTNYYGITMNGAKEFIAANPFIMDNYVEENVGIDTLELWLKQKKAALDRKSFLELDELQKQDTATLNRFQYVNVQKIQETLSHEVFDVHDFTPFLYEVAGSIASAVGAEDFSLYTIEAGSKEITLHQPAFLETDRERLCWPVSEGTTVSAYVGLTKKTLLIADLQNDERFPQGVGLDSVKINSVLCVPFIQANGDLLGIIELVRTLGSPGFTIENQQTATTIVCWTGLAIQNIQACKALSKQQELNDFLLEASQIVLDDKEGSDTLINHIMSYTKNLVQADRCSFFLIDPSTDQLFCSLFDEGQVDQHGRPLFVKKNELRFSMNTGIAGFVARTGQLVNSSNPYEDTRFNRELDLLTGFTTNSILCMPILSNNKVVGVVQMLNKRGGTAFTNTDESTFKSFAVYCSLALLYSKLSQTMYEAKNRLEVQEEKIRYHLHPPEESYKNLLASPLPKKNPKGFFRYEFYCMPHMEKLPKLFISMVHTLFGPDCFDLSKLCRFILTVKQGYRDVPYHNFKHAFTVTHCMFRFLHENPTTFPLMERKALIFACICHDLDHQGYNNMFMKTMKTPLSVLYAESIMESHHYQETLFILQNFDCNVFDHLDKAEYKMMMNEIYHAIISTDLALHFSRQHRLDRLARTGTFDIGNPEHSNLIKAILMNVCDLSSTAKPWDIQIEFTLELYEEFFDQGDKEKAAGHKVISLMDRSKSDSMPSDQIGFITFVCLPGFSTVCELFPNTLPLIDGLNENLHAWNIVKSGQQPQLWNVAASHCKSQFPAKEDASTSAATSKKDNL